MMPSVECLAENNLGIEGARALVPALQSLPGLTSLDIGGEWARAHGGAHEGMWGTELHAQV